MGVQLLVLCDTEYVLLFLFEKLDQFTEYFISTIGNSSQVSDGAGAVLLMKRSVAIRKGFPILGVFRCVML